MKIFLTIIISTFLQVAMAKNLSDSCLSSLKKNSFSLYSNKYSKAFTLLFKGNEFVLGTDSSYLLTNSKVALESECSKMTFVPTPSRIVLLSSTIIEVFSELGLLDKIYGISEKKYLYKSENRLPKAYDLGQMPKAERLLSMSPDFIFAYESPSLESLYDKLSLFKIPVLKINDFKEKHPLGRAELRIVVASIMGKAQTGISIFEKIDKEYQSLKSQVKSKKNVLLGDQLSHGPWRKIGAGTDFGQIVRDAGGSDVLGDFKEDLLNPEVILSKVKDIDIWLPQNNVTKLSALQNRTSFMREFVKAINFPVATYSNRLDLNGGTEFWDRAMMRPDILLRDLITLMNMGKNSNGNKLTWYKVIR